MQDQIALQKTLSFCLSNLASLERADSLSPIEKPDPENVECLCKMLTTVGKKLNSVAEDVKFLKV